MTKAELIDRIARSKDLPPEVTKKIIAKILDLAFAELSGYFVRAKVTRTSNPRFTFPKFGTFTKKQRSGRRGVNPRTLEPIEIEACETVDFKPSVELKQKLNEAAAASPSSPKGRKKKAARGSSKRKPAAGPGGRKLVTREEAELELPAAALLPDAPLRKVARRRDLDSTGTT
jgi:nucleoid DNA-binding protein